MRIILTNDDGFDAPGLNALKEITASLGETITIAPSTPQSYVGHKLTVDQPLNLTKLSDNSYHLLATPADCARVGLRMLRPDADWLLSGINFGANLGVDIYTSGTVAAAREAALLGYKAIALSHYIGPKKVIDWTLAKKRLLPVLISLMKKQPTRPGYWNINIPHPDHNEDCPISYCAVDPSPMDVKFRRDGDQFIYSGVFSDRDMCKGHDVENCLRKAMITVSFIPLEIFHEDTDDKNSQKP